MVKTASASALKTVRQIVALRMTVAPSMIELLPRLALRCVQVSETSVAQGATEAISQQTRLPRDAWQPGFYLLFKDSYPLVIQPLTLERHVDYVLRWS